jgi:hypothetical protein
VSLDLFAFVQHPDYVVAINAPKVNWILLVTAYRILAFSRDAGIGYLCVVYTYRIQHI